MTSITFDTHDLVRELQAADFSEKQAETVVRVISKAQERLLTTEHFNSEMRLQSEHFDSKIDLLRSETKGEQLLVKWMLALVIATNVLPILKNLL